MTDDKATAKLPDRVLEDTASQGAETGLVCLHDSDFKGCTKLLRQRTQGREEVGGCVVRGDLTPAFDRIDEAYTLILGSPIFFGCVTGETCSFPEWLPIPYPANTNPPSSIFERELATAPSSTR